GPGEEALLAGGLQLAEALLAEATTLDEAKYQAFLRREAAKLGPALPAWLAWDGGTAVELAQSIHQDRAYERLPILADALEEAGCTNADLLSRCRFAG